MRTFLISLVWVCVFNVHLFSQLTHQGFLFDTFEKGMIVYKTGGQSSAGRFNYDTVNERVLFLAQDTVMLELDRTDIVLELRILGRTFEPAGNHVFYERIKTGEQYLYVRRLTKIIFEENEGGYGTRPQTGAIDRVNQINSAGGSLFTFNMANNYRLIPENIYYLKDRKGFKRFTSFDSLAKQFKSCRNQMRSYVKNENLDFKVLDDVIRAITFGVETCNLN